MQKNLVDIESLSALLRPRRMSREEARLAQLGIWKQALDILEEKRSGYSGKRYAFNNFYTQMLMGILPEQGAFIRYFDKVARMTQLAYHGHKDNLGEPLLDVFRDKANYDAIVSLLVLETMLNSPNPDVAGEAEKMLEDLIKEGREFDKYIGGKE